MVLNYAPSISGRSKRAWTYRDQMIELCRELQIDYVQLRSDDFRCYACCRGIVVRPPKTVEAITTIAHECAHVSLKHSVTNLPRHRKEYEAGTFEVAYLRRCGIEVPYEIEVRGKRYVARIIAWRCNGTSSNSIEKLGSMPTLISCPSVA